MKTHEQARQIANFLLGVRQPREARWRKLRKYVCPWRGIFEGRIEDNPTHKQMLRFTQAASQAVLRGASGMTTGMTPRNVQWFRPDFIAHAMTEASGARAWLDAVAKLMRDCLAAGGFYQAIQSFNTDLIWAGCALIFAEEADENPLRYECLQPGAYCVALDSQRRLETVLRHARMTPRDMERIFGEKGMSRKAKDMLRNDPLRQLRVWHLVCPNDDSGPHPYASYWWEEGQREFLRVSGYYEMPFFFTCWNEGITPYGTGPGDEALPDAMQMDILERRKLEGLAKIVQPPMQAPKSLEGHMRLGANDITYVQEQSTITPLLDLSPVAAALANLRQEIDAVSRRLQESLIATIFTSVSLEQRPPGMSATEFLERKREALQRLGPVISAYEPNVLTPLLFRTIQAIDRAGLTPIPPEALAGQDLLLSMEFISPMANALRQTGAEVTRAIFQDVAALVQGSGDRAVLDKIDLDQMVDEFAAGLGAPGSVIRADSDVAQIRQQRAQAEAAQQQMAMQMQAAQTQATQAGALASQAQAASAIAGMDDQDAWL
ncbi:MAG: portal protein [Ruminococcus flavefaciens]|nr:portal protein [Ruminococcus flavefaciens]